jgi:hypothetical protein
MRAASASKKGKSRVPARLWIGMVLVALLVAYFLYCKYTIQHKGIEDFYVSLEKRGYTANIGFSGVFRPGNVIQVAEEGADAKARKLVTPIVVAWADKCFPNLSPRTLEFTLPEFRGKSSADLTLTGNMLSRIFPSLDVDNKAVSTYSLTLENVRIQTYAKTDLSSEFSAPCVATLRTAIDGGDKVEWFRVVLEAIVADALTLQMDWSDNASMESREKAAKNAGKVLNQSAATGMGGDAAELKVAVKTNDAKRTIVSARGFVIVGYRARPLQPVRAP